MSLNKVLLIGNLTRDAEVRDAGQNQVASFGLATSEKYKDRNGQQQESTEFHNCELFGNTGVYPYLTKGQQVYVEGSIRTDKWTDQNGVQRESKKIRVFSLQLLGSRPQNQQPAQQPGYAPQPAPAQYQPQPPVQPQAPQGYQYPQQQQYQTPVAPAPPQYQTPPPQQQPYAVPFPQGNDLP